MVTVPARTAPADAVVRSASSEKFYSEQSGLVAKFPRLIETRFSLQAHLEVWQSRSCLWGSLHFPDSGLSGDRAPADSHSFPVSWLSGPRGFHVASVSSENKMARDSFCDDCFPNEGCILSL